MLARRLALLAVFLGACSGNGGSGGTLNSDPTSCPTVGVPSPGDADGDGRSDVQETLGYDIQVDTHGLGTEAGLLAVVRVTSSPTCPDTDEDGLTDLEEFEHRTDPRDPDTDGDGLTDFDEVRRWMTSPVSVDSDGDATGPLGLEAPNSFLFDGNELAVLRTSPSLDDTDGDGVTDFEEFDDPVRDPLVAEIPSASFQFEGEVDIRLRVTYSETQGQETEYGETFTTTDTTTAKTTTLDSAVVESEASTALLKDAAGLFGNFLPKKDGKQKGPDPEARSAVLATIAVCATVAIGTALVYCATAGKRDADGPIHFRQEDPDATRGAVAEKSANVNDKVSGFLCAPKTTDSSSTTLEEESVRSAQESYSKYRRDSRSRTETTASGSVKVGATIRNTGVTTVSVEDLFVTMLHWQPSPDPAAALGAGAFRTLATLKPAVESLVLSPGETSPVVELSAIDVDPSIIKEFLARPGGIVYGPAGISLQNSEGIDFKFLTEKTFARTATVAIDQGDGTYERYQVATNVARDENGGLAGITMGEILGLLGIPFETLEVEREIDGDVVTVRALKSVRGVSSEIVGETGDPEAGVPRNPFGFWLVTTSREESADPSVHFDDLVVRHGDEVFLVYMEDRDGDGLFEREEAILGTSDSGEDVTDNATGEDTPDGLLDGFDTDRDGLSDFVEARVGWVVDITYDVTRNVSYKVLANPRAADADGDGWTDPEEQAAGTDPSNADTDDDTLADPVDPDPLQPALRLYVSQLAPAGGDGRSWATAFKELRDALDLAGAAAVDTIPGTTDPDRSNDVSEIWVAEGTYTPHASDRTASFVLVDGISLYGGFAGFEGTLEQRNPDPLTNYCVLSGDLAGNDAGHTDLNDASRSDNSLHVLRADASVRSARVAGFQIFGGNGLNVDGGGLLNSGGRIDLTDLIFSFHAARSGAAVADTASGGRLTISNCTFQYNTATASGGAVLLRNGEISDCVFRQNDANQGGGIAVVGSGGSLTAVRCEFDRNRAITDDFFGPQPQGGGIYGDRFCTKLHLETCDFHDNYAGPPASGAGGKTGRGAGVYLFVSENTDSGQVRRTVTADTRILNCRFVDNTVQQSPNTSAGLLPPATGAAISIFGAFDVTQPGVEIALTQCTVVGNVNRVGLLSPGFDDYPVVDLRGCRNLQVANSIFWDNLARDLSGSNTSTAETAQLMLGERDSSGNPLSRRAIYCCIRSLGTGPFGSAGLIDPATNIKSSPLFVDAGGRDLRLDAGSPCVDAGLNAVDTDLVAPGSQKLPATDFDGNARVVDGDNDGKVIVDMGAYERR